MGIQETNMRFASFTVLSLVSASLLLAETIHVPGDQPTIQDGLNLAETGDSVLVAAGEYNVDIVSWPNRNGIALIGAGMDSTFVIGDEWQSLVYVTNAVEIDSTTFIQGMTFRRGGDAGIVLYGASPTIESCRFDSTTAGSGMYIVEGSEALVNNCEISNNAGPGVRVQDCELGLRLTYCRIHGNDLTRSNREECIPFSIGPLVRDNVPYGGGVYCRNSSPTFIECVVEGNYAIGGGGVYCYSSSNGSFINCRITGNMSVIGGGIHCRDHSEPTIIDCDIEYNTASDNGGGLYLEDHVCPVLTDCRITGNSANISGGGIWCKSSSPVITHCEFTGNRADALGGGIFCYGGPSYLTLTGCTLSYNSADSGGGIYGYWYSYYAITSCVFVYNLASVGGAATWSTECEGIIDHCSFSQNAAEIYGDGFYIENGAPSTYNSNFYDNGWAIHNGDPVAVPQATENWWGADDGPWHQSNNPSGSGDSLSVYAWDFIPWLQDALTDAPPFPPRGLALVERELGGVRLHWEPLPLADLAGYCVHIDIDSLGFDYDDLVDVGNETSVFLSGLELGIGYRVAVSSYDIDGNPSSPGRPIWVVAEAVDVPEGLPNQILTSSYPNPFNPSTTIRFSLPAPGTVTLTVYDLTGRRIARIIDGDDFPVGHHEAVWSGVDDAGNSVSSGVYLYRLEAGEFVQTRKMTLLK